MKFKIVSLLMMVTLLMLATTGCLYPDENNPTKVSYRESVNRIQMAMEDFQKENAVLPMINAGQDTPRYEKFRVDLVKLKNMGFIDEIPNTAFEMGGSGYFLIQNEETDPTIKVMDLVTVQKVNDVQLAVDKYKRGHANQLPKAKEIYPNIYSVDLSKVGVPSITLSSVYSGEDMAFVMDSGGQVYVDYAYDIMQAIDKSEQKPLADEDLRGYLVNNSYYVPAKSLPYTWNNGAPVAVLP
ncbi:hypothetical protein [Paenibacillus glacialis]|uniref:ABC transporter periplasmic binding protein yphF n=1 Tax=Paenibacillus glacialis TaxID=494026 RepID=A0A168M627_9BACL|nr:hypothetical protein [Paenibacillus glacialis]OAB44267.1 hypothetical protein PGLA_06275 [Paenibacillus glacialis]